jgi:hypothetical protein
VVLKLVGARQLPTPLAGGQITVSGIYAMKIAGIVEFLEQLVIQWVDWLANACQRCRESVLQPRLIPNLSSPAGFSQA